MPIKAFWIWAGLAAISGLVHSLPEASAGSDRPPSACEILYRRFAQKSYLKEAVAASVAIHAGALAIPRVTPSQTPLSPESAEQRLGQSTGFEPGDVGPSSSKAMSSLEKPKTVFEALPTKPKAVVTLEPKFTPVRSVEELIAEAKAALDTLRKTGRLPIDIGKFFIESELADSSPKSKFLDTYLGRYGLTQEVTLQEFNKSGRLHDALRYLNTQATGNYCANAALVIDYFERGCGNCEGHSKVLLGSLAQPGIRLEPGQRLGVLNYENHFEPVIFDTKKDRVMPLSSGRWSDKIDAPVYDPALLLAGYLEGKSIDLDPEIRRALLLRPLPRAAHPTPERKQGATSAALKTNTRLQFSSFEAAPALEGLPPNFAQRSFPDSAQDGESLGSGGPGRLIAQSYALQSSQEGGGLRVTPKGITYYGKPVKVISKRKHALFAPYPSHLTWDETGESQLELENDALRAQVKGARSTEELIQILARAYQQEILNVATSPAAQRLLKYWQDPALLSSLTAKEVEEMIETVVRLDQFSDGYDSAGLRNLQPRDRGERRQSRKNWWKSASPAELALREQAKAYSEYMNQNQEKIAQGLDQLSPEDRMKFFRLNEQLVFDILDVPSPLHRLRERFVNREIQVQAPDPQIAAQVAKPLQVKILYVDKANDPRFSIPSETGTEGTQGRSGSESKPRVDPTQPKPTQAKPVVTFSPETMVQFILSTTPASVHSMTQAELFSHEAMRVWGQADLTAALERVDPTHRWDNRVRQLSYSRPTLEELSSLGKDNPLLAEIKSWNPTSLFEVGDDSARGERRIRIVEAVPRRFAEYIRTMRQRENGSFKTKGVLEPVENGIGSMEGGATSDGLPKVETFIANSSDAY